MVPVQQVDLLVHLWFMTDPATIATHFRHVHFGGNWTCVNLRDTLKDVTWQEALHTREGFNSIAVLTYHIHYFVHAVLQVLEGGPLDAHDTFSFTHPPITNDADWQELLEYKQNPQRPSFRSSEPRQRALMPFSLAVMRYIEYR